MEAAKAEMKGILLESTASTTQSFWMSVARANSCVTVTGEKEE